jgi:hypothetical protein
MYCVTRPPFRSSSALVLIRFFSDVEIEMDGHSVGWVGGGRLLFRGLAWEMMLSLRFGLPEGVIWKEERHTNSIR